MTTRHRSSSSRSPSRPTGHRSTRLPAALSARSNDHRMNPVSLTGSGTGVRFVRLTELSNQGPDNNSQDHAYRTFMDMSELEVYGTPGFVAPHAAFSVSGPHSQGASLTFNGSASTHDPNLSITQYHWSFGDGSTGSGKVAASHLPPPWHVHGHIQRQGQPRSLLVRVAQGRDQRPLSRAERQGQVAVGRQACAELRRLRGRQGQATEQAQAQAAGGGRPVDPAGKT